LGDPQGDKLLRDTASILEDNVRKTIDTVVRGHGDTFYIFLDGADEQEIRDFFERVNPQFVNGNKSINADGNIGIALGGIVVTTDKFPNPKLLRGENIIRQEQIYQSYGEQLRSYSNAAMLKAKGPIDKEDFRQIPAVMH